MNITHTHSTLNAAAELGCRIQIWHLRPGATSSAHGQWDDADPTVKPTFECPAHLYRVHPDDVHLLRADYEQRALEHQHLLDMLGAKDHADAGRIIGELHAATMQEAPADAGGKAVQVEAVAEYSPERGLSWLIEGEGCDLPDGTILCTIDEQHLLDDGSTVLYTRPAPAVANDVLYADAAETREREDHAMSDKTNERGEPDEIWMQIHGDANPADYPDGPLPDLRGYDVTWCWEPIFEHDVKYVRADIVAAIEAENARLQSIINTPQSDDFLRATSTEAEHQRQRWGSDHDTGKTPADWFWLIGYLSGKALHAHMAGDPTKAEHHIITTAAACANWHRAMFGNTDMRPGIDSSGVLVEADHG